MTSCVPLPPGERPADAPPLHRVAVLALDGVIPFELGIPSRILGGACTNEGLPLYDVRVCSLDGSPVRTSDGFSVVPEHGPEELAAADTVVVPPTVEMRTLADDGSLTVLVADALACIRPGTRVVSICNGAYALAAAGLLDGRPATTHWWETAHFQSLFPLVHLDEDVLFVDDGDVLTSAGAAAGVDLCLHLVRRDHGSATANAVARRCVVPPWRDGGQAQYIERPVPEPTTTTTAPTRAWALERLDRPLTLTELAAHARMSVRTFTRRFRDEAGTTPGQWLTAQRVELAKQLLETSDLTVDHIADRAGFGSGNSLRQHMRAQVGISPAAYRRAFHRTSEDTTAKDATVQDITAKDITVQDITVKEKEFAQ